MEPMGRLLPSHSSSLRARAPCDGCSTRGRLRNSSGSFARAEKCSGLGFRVRLYEASEDD